MESVEFFIQQEGDRTWLPLESPEVEILEGRYRLVARCFRPNIPVEVRVSYQPLETDEGESKAWKREKNTNQEGLMVVLPFTYFQPGIWELTCSGNASSSLGNNWQHTVKLQTLPKDTSEVPPSPSTWEDTRVAEPPETSIDTDQEPTSPSPEPEPTPSDSSSEPVAGESHTESPGEQPNNEDAPNIAATVSNRSYVRSWHLILDRETYVLEQQTNVTLSGRIEITGTTSVELPDGILQIRLYDPQTSQVLFDQQYAAPESIPSSFGYSLELAGESKRLMLGEARLYDAYGKQLAMGTFSIMAQLQAWLDNFSQEPSEAEDHPPSPSPSTSDSQQREKADINLSFLDLVNRKDSSQETSEPAAKDETETQQSNTNSILPPQLQPTETKPANSQPSPQPRPSKSPELPTFGKPLHQESPQASPPADTPPAESPSPPEVQPEPQPEANTASEELPTIPASEEPNQMASETRSQEPEVTLSSEAAAFPALQNRLWSRLNAIARDGELAEWLRWHLPPLTESANEVPQTTAETTDEETGDVEATNIEDEGRTEDTFASEPASEGGNRSSHEIVVMDEEEESDSYGYGYSSNFLSMPGFSSHAGNREVPSQPATDAGEEQRLAERSFTPQFSLPEEDFIAGRQIWVTVKIPIWDARVYVKLWLQDCESRTLLDGPYWLTEFTPDGWGYELASTEITIPYGCLQVQLEAIAVDVLTHQESYKASVRRLVVPPGPPTLPQT